MSETPTHSTTEFVIGETDPDEWIRENREALEFEANSDAPDAWVFQRLLNSIEDGVTAVAPIPDGSDTGLHCPSCGEGIDAADAFCRYCGREI